MLSFIIVLAAWAVLQRQLATITSTAPSTALAPKRSSAHLTQLVTYADRLYSERKWLAAEKAYLSVLKADHKNVTAYIHLGVIYSTQKSMEDAIECFAIATRLRPTATSYQNLALAYYDNHNYIKSIATYEKAIMFEPNATRYIGLGNAQLKLHNLTAAISDFERAVELDPTKRGLQKLAEAYDEAGRPADAKAIRARLKNG